MGRAGFALIALIFAVAPGWAAPEVVDSSTTGFTVKVTLTIAASPEVVYRKIVKNIGDWWDPEHTYTGNSHNLSIEEKPLGCFCEKLPNQGGVRHMEVVRFAPGKVLVMTGGLGPLQSLAATGSMTIKLSPAAGGTDLDVTYAVTGYLPKGMNTWAAPVSTGLTEQFTRLKNYVEQGVHTLPITQP
jgi:uncharacterized protein YndB with AHSA1/START domain